MDAWLDAVLEKLKKINGWFDDDEGFEFVALEMSNVFSIDFEAAYNMVDAKFRKYIKEV